jgi:hypothetical protein
VLDKTRLSGQTFLSSTVANGKFWLRACIINPRAKKQDIEFLVKTIRETGMALVRSAAGVRISC